MTDFLLHMAQGSGCISIDPGIVGALITTLGTLAGIWLREWMETRRQASKKPKPKPAVAQQTPRRPLSMASLLRFWKFRR